MNTFLEIIRKLRVSFGYLSSIIILIFSKPKSYLMFLIGAFIAFFGELIRVWASSYIIKLDQLTTEGPYQEIRNPLYFGSFLILVGISIISFNIWFILLYLLFFIIYYFTIKAEEKELTKKFKDYYISYCQTTSAFFPNLKIFFKSFIKFITSLKNLNIFKIRFSNFIKNREYNGLIALIIVLIIFYIKLLNYQKNKNK